jgi:hypothetical protein
MTGQFGRHHLMEQTEVDLVLDESICQFVLADHGSLFVDLVDGWHRLNP